jgi:RNA recognition motif-containing protein
MKYDEKSKFRGMAVVIYEDVKDAERAVENSNRYRIRGRRIFIKFNDKKKEQEELEMMNK